MNKHDFLQKLSHLYEVTPLLDTKECFLVNNSTPSHVFHTVIKFFGDGILAFPSRDRFYRVETLELIDEIEMSFDVSKMSSDLFTIDRKKRSHTAGIDFYCVLGSDFHDTFSTKFPDAQQKTVVIIPVYRCEFSGNESPAVLKLMRKEFVPTLDWDRPPFCKATVAFENKSTGVKSTNRGLSKQEFIFKELHSFRGGDGSSMEIENFLGQRIAVTRRNDDNYQIDGVTASAMREHVPTKLLEDRIGGFLKGEA